MADQDESNQSIGGKARAAKLSKEERTAIAQAGADARWGNNLPQATHSGELIIGGRKIACAVLRNHSAWRLRQGRAAAAHHEA